MGHCQVASIRIDAWQGSFLGKLNSFVRRYTVELNTAAERWLGIIASGIALLCSSVFAA